MVGRERHVYLSGSCRNGLSVERGSGGLCYCLILGRGRRCLLWGRLTVHRELKTGTLRRFCRIVMLRRMLEGGKYVTWLRQDGAI